MKKPFTFIMMTILTFSVFAQAPQKISYQAVIRNSNGQLIVSHSVGMKISILQGSATGTPVYVETQTPTTNSNGLATVDIGGGTVVSGTFEGIDWSTGTYFIKTETDPAGGTNYSITGSSQILSVPYAIFAKSAANGFSGNYNDLTNKPALFDGTWTSLTGEPSTLAGYGITDAVTTYGDQTIAGNKTFTGTINASNKRITGVGDPINNQDAITKAYANALATDIDEKFDLLKAQIKTLEDNLIDAGIYKLTDIDGNQYNYVKIGTQIWMAENLRTTHFNDGKEIPLWGYMEDPGAAYCWYNNDETTYKATFGALYNYLAIGDNSKLCPTNWHIPTDAEWTTMENYLIANGYNFDGSTTGNKIAKSLAAITDWTSSGITGAVGNTGYPLIRNKTGFTALPGGYRIPSGSFNDIHNRGLWWSVRSEYVIWIRSIDYNRISVSRLHDFTVGSGLSVRCVRD